MLWSRKLLVTAGLLGSLVVGHAAQPPGSLPLPPDSPPPPPLPPGQPVVTFAPSTPIRVMTHKEFAKCFNPIPGEHTVTLIHPYTGCPVTVCFTLPCETARRVVCDGNDFAVKYGLIRRVQVQFHKNGTYKVHYIGV